MGAGMSANELAELSVSEVADLISDSSLAEYRQSCIDFGIDGEMLTRLPVDQLVDALGRAGVDDKQHLEFLVAEIENIRSPKTDPSKLDRQKLRELLDRSDSIDWDERSDVSEWSGVSLDTEDRILGLNVANSNLSGELPAALGEISKLQYLHATSNLFTGGIPDAIGGLRELASLHFLVELRVRENKLAGKIPPLLSNMRSLQVLDLTSNSLQGHIPESLGGMTDLRELWLGGNQFVGAIPETLSKLEDLQSLDLSRNKFAGKIQSRTFSALSSSLVYLNLSHNAFEGALPLAALSPHSAGETPGSSRGSDSVDPSEERKSTRERRIEAAAGTACSSLSYANLSNNKFIGRVSGEVGGLTSLETLDLSHNKLDGEIPSDIGNCVSLRVLSFSRCGLSGRLDGNSGEGLGRLRLLETLRLDGNTLEGSVPPSFGNLTRLEVLQLQLASRPDCAVRADELVIEDTEATMLGSKLDEWFLMPRKAFLNLQEFPCYTSVRPCLVRHVSTVVPYECHVFAGAKGRRLVVRRKEIAFFSHCWDLPPDQCPPKPELLDGPHPDTPDGTKLRHMKACLQEAPESVQYVWADMLCAPLADSKRRRAAGRSVPFFVQNSGRFYALAPDSPSLERYKKRAWCRLEALCAACPYQPCQLESAFSVKPAWNSSAARYVYDAVEFFVSIWEKGSRYEERLGGCDELEAAGFLRDPVIGKLSDPKDRQDIAEATLGAVNAMELAGQITEATAKLVRFSAKRVLYGSQGLEGHGAEEEEGLSLRSDQTSGGGSGGGGAVADVRADGRFSRKRGVISPKGGAASVSVQ
eukprot:g11230.t1